MKTYIVTIEGNNGFYREHAGPCTDMRDAYNRALKCLLGDQDTTIEQLRITKIEEHKK